MCQCGKITCGEWPIRGYDRFVQMIFGDMTKTPPRSQYFPTMRTPVKAPHTFVDVVVFIWRKVITVRNDSAKEKLTYHRRRPTSCEKPDQLVQLAFGRTDVTTPRLLPGDSAGNYPGANSTQHITAALGHVTPK